MAQTSIAALDHDSIALRAYYLWEAEGRPEGRHEAHWFTAEAAEKRSLSAKRAATTRRAKQEAAPKASAKQEAAPKASARTLVAAAALKGAAARTSRRAH